MSDRTRQGFSFKPIGSLHGKPVFVQAMQSKGAFDPETAAIERNGPIVRSSLTVVHLIEKSSGDRAQHADIRSSQTLLVQAFSFELMRTEFEKTQRACLRAHS